MDRPLAWRRYAFMRVRRCLAEIHRYRNVRPMPDAYLRLLDSFDPDGFGQSLTAGITISAEESNRVTGDTHLY